MRKLFALFLAVLVLFPTFVSAGNITGGLTTGGHIPFSNGTDAVTEDTAFCYTNNRLGLGTCSPSQMIHGQSDSGTAVQWDRYSSTPSARAVFQFYKSAGTIASPSAVSDGDKLGSVSFCGNDGSASQCGAQVEAFVDSTVSSGNVPARVSITTGSNSSNRAERLSVSNDGKVGIGTTSPSSQLHVESTAADVLRIRRASGSSGNTAEISFVDPSGNISYVGRPASGFFGVGPNSDLGSSPYIYTDTSGNTGFGTNSPAVRVQVDCSASGNVCQKIKNTHASGLSGIGYFDESDNAKAFVGWDNANDVTSVTTFGSTPLDLRTNSTARVYIDGSGNICFGTSCSSPAWKWDGTTQTITRSTLSAPAGLVLSASISGDRAAGGSGIGTINIPPLSYGSGGPQEKTLVPGLVIDITDSTTYTTSTTDNVGAASAAAVINKKMTGAYRGEGPNLLVQTIEERARVANPGIEDFAYGYLGIMTLNSSNGSGCSGTTTTASVAIGATSVSVVSTAGFPGSGTAVLGAGDTFTYSGTSGGNTFTGVSGVEVAWPSGMIVSPQGCQPVHGGGAYLQTARFSPINTMVGMYIRSFEFVNDQTSAGLVIESGDTVTTGTEFRQGDAIRVGYRNARDTTEAWTHAFHLAGPSGSRAVITNEGIIRASSNDASAPGFSFTGDTNTGINGNADTMTLITGGTVRLTIGSSGDVVIANASGSGNQPACLDSNGRVYRASGGSC